MKYTVLVIISIVLAVALAGTVLSQSKRTECLRFCTAQGDACAERAYQARAVCTDETTACESALKGTLRQCAAQYDACRYACDLPRF